MSNEIQLKTFVKENTGVITVSGFVDAHTYENLQDEITDVLEENPDMENLILDISNVSYMSSAGIGVVVNSNAELAEREGKMILVNPAPSVMEVFETFGLADMIIVFPSLDEAFSDVGVSSNSSGSGTPPSDRPSSGGFRHRKFDF